MTDVADGRDGRKGRTAKADQATAIIFFESILSEDLHTIPSAKYKVAMAYDPEMYQANKARIAEAQKRYYERNRAERLRKQKEYDAANAEKIKERQLRYRLARKARLEQPIN
jgi:hypothetical protein